MVVLERGPTPVHFSLRIYFGEASSEILLPTVEAPRYAVKPGAYWQSTKSEEPSGS